VSAVVLVEGASDRIALETLARRQGRDLAAEGVSIVAIGGAQAVGRVVADLRGTASIAGLCDAGEEALFRRAGFGSTLYVCHADLEDELIRALGTDAVKGILEANGDLGSFRTLQKQAVWRGRPVEDQLRRFMGSGARRKGRYAALLVEALDLSAMPPPLVGVLARARPNTCSYHVGSIANGLVRIWTPCYVLPQVKGESLPCPRTGRCPWPLAAPHARTRHRRLNASWRISRSFFAPVTGTAWRWTPSSAATPASSA
jgi:hypothetical protein